jgi:hypothetical protein
MIDVSSFHPCAIAVKVADIKNTFEITYHHAFKKGTCVRCGEPRFIVLESWLTALPKAEAAKQPQSLAVLESARALVRIGPKLPEPR